jgi:hypothetical protein
VLEHLTFRGIRHQTEGGMDHLTGGGFDHFTLTSLATEGLEESGAPLEVWSTHG